MESKIEKGKKYIMNTYGRLPVLFVRGQGSWLYDEEGNKYLDFVAGIAVNCLGHSNQLIKEALAEQADKLIHTSNLYWIEGQIDLAERLCQKSGMDKAFFCNSGAEANEGAIKLARKWGRPQGRYEIISALQSFHGRTMGALAATGQEKYQTSFQPLLPGFSFVNFNNLQEIKVAINEKTAAIILEPIQGEGGLNEPAPGYLKEVAELCKEEGILLILDEVQTGIGRTGKDFAFQHYGIEPDIITLAKGLGGGLPIGALLARGQAAETFQPGDHASTFGGNPLVTHVANQVCQKVLSEDFLEEVREKSAYMIDGLQGLKDKYPFISQIKGRGLMLGLECGQRANTIVDKMLERKILINAIGGKTLRFVPPLNLKKEEIDLLIENLDQVLEEVE